MKTAISLLLTAALLTVGFAGKALATEDVLDTQQAPDNSSEVGTEVPEEINFEIDATGWPILVDGNQIDAPKAFQTEDGIVMVPIRAIAQALGYEVNWDGATRSVRLGVAIHLWIGNTEAHVGRMAPINISTAPQIVNGSTYVPLDFFRNVLGVPNAFAFEGQIEIHSEGERME